MKIEVLASGKKIADLKRSAKAKKKSEGISHAEALDRVAAENAYASWSELAQQAWSLNDSSDLCSTAFIPGTDTRVPVFSPLIEIDEDLDLDHDWSVNISVEFFDEGQPYLYVDFVAENDGTNFTLNPKLHRMLEAAIEAGSVSSSVAAQAAVIEDIFGWYEAEWLAGFTYHVACQLERYQRGIAETDITWQEPLLGGYGRSGFAVRVYHAPDGRYLVCYESDEKITLESSMKPFSLIDEQMFKSVHIDPYDFPATHAALIKAAGLKD